VADQVLPDWWNRGDPCQACGIPWCARHSPNEGDSDQSPERGPLGTTGLERFKIGPIEVFFLDWHSVVVGRKTQVGEAVYWGKSYDGKPGSQDHAYRVASASAMWLARSVVSGDMPRPVAVVAVPAKPERRGISLPAVIAESIAAELKIPSVQPFRWLADTKQVKAVTPAERQQALDPQLQTIGEVPAGTVLLVDDVIQTGATIAVIERKLRKAGASKVIGFAPSRART